MSEAKNPKANDASAKTANAMWGGRFSAGPAEVMELINPSIDFDRRFYKQDIRASQAHAEMLSAQDIISKEDAALVTDKLPAPKLSRLLGLPEPSTPGESEE